MSRQNKVNPGTYTQRGRLSQDDAARELRKQSAIGSPHTWQPVNTKARPWLAPAAVSHGLALVFTGCQVCGDPIALCLRNSRAASS